MGKPNTFLTCSIYVFSLQIYDIYNSYTFHVQFYVFYVCMHLLYKKHMFLCVLYMEHVRKEHVAMYLPHTLHICFVLGLYIIRIFLI